LASSQYNKTLITNSFSTSSAAGAAAFFASGSAYFYVGSGDSAWDSSPASIPSIESSISSQRAIWDSMIGISHITGRDIRLGIKRYDWTSGTTYVKYNENPSDVYYVLAGSLNRDVYKCLDTNGDSPSTSKPINKNMGISREKEPDGYVWKYMFTIPDIEFYEFATDSFLPVSFTDYSVRAAAIDGSILNATIPANNTIGTGQSYRGSGFSTGTLGVSLTDGCFAGVGSFATFIDGGPGASVNKITGINVVLYTAGTNQIMLASNTPLGFVYGEDDPSKWGDYHSTYSTNEWSLWNQTGISSTDNFYANSVLYVTTGLSTGQFRTIKSNQNINKVQTFTLENPPLETMSPGDKILIGPKIEIEGDKGGSGFVGIGEVNGKGNLVSISVLSSGRNYTNSSGTMVATVNGAYAAAPHGSGATVNVYTSPFGGHGNNPASELNAKYLIISARTPRAKADNYGNGQYAGPDGTIRQIGIVMGAELSKNMPASSPSYDSRTTMYFAHPVPTMGGAQDFKKDATITNANTGATATIWSVDGSATEQYITVTDVRGDFTHGDVITAGATNIKVSSANLASYTYPSGTTIAPNEATMYNGVAKYSGDIIYHENISPSVSRSDSQVENFKIVFEL